MRKLLGKILRTAVAGAALVMLAVQLWFPILKISGTSMEPMLKSGDLVCASKIERLHSGDVIAFTHGDAILVKRIIATQGQWVDIQDTGVVYINGQKLEETYAGIADESTNQDGELCSMADFPILIPQGQYFVMSDQRENSIDSRSIGCITEDQILGKVFFRIWPIGEISRIH